MPAKDESSEERRAYKREWDRKNRVGKRHQVWTGIFYEDTSPDWREEIEELCIPVCVSPLHDRDTWTARDQRKNPEHIEGEIKEPHRHFLVEYPTGVDYETVKADFAFLSGGKRLKFVKSKSAMALYLVHAADKDKAKYDPAEVLEFCGANWHDWCADLQDLHAMMKEMRAWLRENPQIHHWEFSDFQDWCDVENDVWSRALDLQCAWAIGNYIDRQRSKIEQARKVARAQVAPQYEQHEHHENLHEQHENLHEQHENLHDLHENLHEIACPNCGSVELQKRGRTASDLQRYLCKDCGKSFV